MREVGEREIGEGEIGEREIGEREMREIDFCLYVLVSWGGLVFRLCLCVRAAFPVLSLPSGGFVANLDDSAT